LPHDSCRRLIINFSNCGNKPVTGFGDGLNISVVARLLVESLAKSRHISVEIPLLDITVRPNVLDQVLFGHDFAGPLQKDQQNSEDRWRNRLDTSGASEKELSGVDSKIIKFVDASFVQHAALKAFRSPKGKYCGINGSTGKRST